MESRQSLRERVAQLESVVKSILQKVENDDGSSGSEKSTTAVTKAFAHADLATAETVIEHAPIMSLFNNSMLDSHAELEIPAWAPSKQVSEAEAKIRQKLLLHLPSERDLDIIFIEGATWWGVWQHMFPDWMTEVSDGNALAERVKKSIKSGSLLVLAKALLCISLCLQQLPASFIQRKLSLPASAETIRHHYICMIDKYILSNDEYVGTLEGLECLVLTTKLDSNDGKPRKTWLTCRRGLSFAVMMGIHRASKWNTPHDTMLGMRRKLVFFGLFQVDRYYSLVLGLPYAISNTQCDLQKLVDGMEQSFPGLDLSLLCGLAHIGGDLIDRSQNAELVSYEGTMKLNQEMERLGTKVPELVRRGEDISSIPFEELYGRSLSRFFFHHLRSHLHLPFLLNPADDPRFEFNRHAALESAREMIKAYQVLRANAHHGFCACKVIDFQVLTASIMLALHHLGVTRPDKVRDMFTEEHDWNLISEVKKLFEDVSAEMGPGGGGVSDQAARALGLFLEGRNCARGQSPRPDVDKCQVVIPYFGRITIQPRNKEMCPMNKEPLPTQQLPTPISNSASSTPSTMPLQWHSPSAGLSQTSASSVSGNNSSGSSPSNNAYVAFNPYNLPMPMDFNGGNSSLPITNDPVGNFNEDLISNFPEWTGGNEWPGMSTDIPLELDSDWNWIVSGVGSS